MARLEPFEILYIVDNDHFNHFNSFNWSTNNHYVLIKAILAELEPFPLKVHTYECFGHVFEPFGPKTSELEPFKNLPIMPVKYNMLSAARDMLGCSMKLANYNYNRSSLFHFQYFI